MLRGCARLALILRKTRMPVRRHLKSLCCRTRPAMGAAAEHEAKKQKGREAEKRRSGEAEKRRSGEAEKQRSTGPSFDGDQTGGAARRHSQAVVQRHHSRVKEWMPCPHPQLLRL
jgi:hypothetical protein